MSIWMPSQRGPPRNGLGRSRSYPRRVVERTPLILSARLFDCHGLYVAHGSNEAYRYPHQVGTTGSCLPLLIDARKR